MVPIGVATWLQPNIQLTMMGQERVFFAQIHDPRRTCDMPLLQTALKTIRVPLHEIDELIRSILFAGMAFTITAEEFKEGLTMHREP